MCVASTGSPRHSCHCLAWKHLCCPACLCPYMPTCFSKEKIKAQVYLPGKALLSFSYFPFREPPLFFFLHQPFILAFFREAATLRAPPKASPQTPKLLFYCDLELTLKIKISNTSYLFCLLLVPRYHDSNYVLQPHHLSNLTTEFYCFKLHYPSLFLSLSVIP